jgi:AraC-like DNA-binding protein
MATATAPDRLRSLIDVVVASLDDPAGGEELARRAHLSRFHFDRLVAAALGESPAAFRRRLLLERAAFELRAGAAVTRTALDAGYGSAEAFARAFRRSFGVAPSAFAGPDFRLAAPNGVHFHPPGGLLIPGSERRTTMDLTDRMLEHDLWVTRRLLEAAAALPAPSLDEPFRVTPAQPHAFEQDEPTVRDMLERLIRTKEIWTASIAGRATPEHGGTTVDELRARLEDSGTAFAAVVRDVRDRGAWDTAFVDALCEPPETFTYGGAVAHILTRSAHRRAGLVGALRSLGADVGSGDPLEWERAL